MRAYLRAIEQERNARKLDLLDLIVTGTRGKAKHVAEVRRELGAASRTAPAPSINLSGNRD